MHTIIKATTILAASSAALATALACGGSQPEANTPTNEGAPPSTESNPNAAPNGNDTSGTDTTGGGSSGMGAGGAAPGNETTTPPDGYAGSSGTH
jgi:hypothetical protein